MEFIKKHIWLLIVSIALFVGMMVFIPAFSAFSASILKIAIGGSLFFLFDRYVLIEVDTIEELKKGNIAYALFILGYALVIAAAIASE